MLAGLLVIFIGAAAEKKARKTMVSHSQCTTRRGEPEGEGDICQISACTKFVRVLKKEARFLVVGHLWGLEAVAVVQLSGHLGRLQRLPTASGKRYSPIMMPRWSLSPSLVVMSKVCMPFLPRTTVKHCSRDPLQ